MICQRWRQHRDSYRPAGEPICTRDYAVASLQSDALAKSFVTQHHYSRSYPAARFRFGLYRHDELVGVAVFSHPVSDAVLTKVFTRPATEAAELGRFVLLDSVPANGESWFLARCFEELRRELVGVVSFSDPVPRTTTEGAVVMPGHVGTIYQASNGVYLGRGRGQTLALLPDGTVFSRRSYQKILHRERGWRYAAAMLEAFGAEPLTEDADARTWAGTRVPRLTRPVRHPGNHKYCWAFDKSVRRRLPASGTYPKKGDLEKPAKAGPN